METKHRSLLGLLGLALGTAVILAVSLPEFHLGSGQPLPLGGDFKISVMGESAILPGGNLILMLIRGFLALMVIALPIYIVYSLFSPEGRRRLLSEFILLVIVFFLLNQLGRMAQNQQEEKPAVSIEAPKDQSLPESNGSGEAETFEAQTPESLVWITSIVVALFVTGLVAVGIWIYFRRHSPRTTAFERLANEAEKAAAALQGGEDFKNTIIRCYYQMSQILFAEQGIRREIAMTPHEFEQALEEKGFPSEPIHYLTHIFEDVRYGNRQPEQKEEDKAVFFLSVIADVSRGSRSG
jgi:hypothetical protein